MRDRCARLDSHPPQTDPPLPHLRPVLELFYLAINLGENNGVRRTLLQVAERLRSPDFEAVLIEVREKLELAISI
jgi:hypothetical protein